MGRREAMAKIGLLAGAVYAAPTLLNLGQAHASGGGGGGGGSGGNHGSGGFGAVGRGVRGVGRGIGHALGFN